jgi:uncharacterized membrane protein YcaP (DUF421 family)
MILSYLRTIILYLVLIAGMRLLGKRQIGQLEPSEFVLAMLIADLASIPMQDSGIPLLFGLVPIVTILSLELTLSGLTMASVRFRRLLCGKPVILIENGRLIQENLRKVRITLDELTAKLRLKDVLDLKTVQYAILETDGSLSVFPFPKDMPATAKDAGIQAKKQYLPVTIIEDGYFSRENLQRSGKTEAWLTAVLEAHRSKPEDTFLLTVDSAGKVNWVGKEGKP